MPKIDFFSHEAQNMLGILRYGILVFDPIIQLMVYLRLTLKLSLVRFEL